MRKLALLLALVFPLAAFGQSGTIYKSKVGNYTSCLSGGVSATCSVASSSGVRGLWFNKLTSDTTATGIGWARSGTERWGLGEDFTAGTRSYFVPVYSDKATPSGSSWAPNDVISVAWGGAELDISAASPRVPGQSGCDGPKFRFNSFWVPGSSSNTYSNAYTLEVYSPTLQTSGAGIWSALFQSVRNAAGSTVDFDSGGIQVNVTGARPALNIINETNAANTRKAFIVAGRGGSTGFGFGTDIPSANTQNWSIYDYTAAAYRLYINPSGDIGIGTASPAVKLDVAGAISATGAGAFGGALSGTNLTLSGTVFLGVRGTTLPATCSVGQEFFDTDALAGQNKYGCTAPNTWTLEGDGGGTVAFSAVSGGTNSTAPMVIGTGASLAASGSGTIAATSVPGTGVSGNITGTAANISGTVLETHGGTGQTSYAQGDLIYASSANTLAKLAKSAVSTRYLSNTGASSGPAWAGINLSDGFDASTALPATNGGTGLFGGTQTALLYWASATAIGASASLGENAIVIGHAGAGGPTGSAATATAGGSIALPTAQTLDIAAHATDGGFMVLKEGADDGSNTFTLKVPDAGLTASKTLTLVAATGNLPASAIEDSGTVSKCAHFNASGILVAASGDCATGGGGTGTVTGVGPGCTTGLCYTNATTTSGTVFSVWEGATSDANQWNINVPADPTAVINWTVPDATTALTFPSGTDTLIGKATTDTLTNKTISYAANTITLTEKLWLPAAGCNNATAAPFWDIPTANPAAPACVTGSNTQKAYLDFPDADGAYSAQTSFALPSGWTGTLAAKIKWLSAITTGNVFWQVSAICVADAETDDPAFNTASTVADAAKGTTNQTNDAAIASVTVTGCAAGELMHLKIARDRTDGSDTLGASSARLIGVELTLIRQVAQ